MCAEGSPSTADWPSIASLLRRRRIGSLDCARRGRAWQPARAVSRLIQRSTFGTSRSGGRERPQLELSAPARWQKACAEAAADRRVLGRRHSGSRISRGSLARLARFRRPAKRGDRAVEARRAAVALDTTSRRTQRTALHLAPAGSAQSGPRALPARPATPEVQQGRAGRRRAVRRESAAPGCVRGQPAGVEAHGRTPTRRSRRRVLE